MGISLVRRVKLDEGGHRVAKFCRVAVHRQPHARGNDRIQPPCSAFAAVKSSEQLRCEYDVRENLTDPGTSSTAQEQPRSGTRWNLISAKRCPRVHGTHYLDTTQLEKDSTWRLPEEVKFPFLALVSDRSVPLLALSTIRPSVVPLEYVLTLCVMAPLSDLPLSRASLLRV